MAKRLILPEHDLLVNSQKEGFHARNSYEDFLNHFKNSIDKEDLECSVHRIEKNTKKFNDSRKHYNDLIKEELFLSLFLIWSKNNFVKEGHPDYGRMLVEKKILSFESKQGSLLKVKEVDDKYLENILQTIRCRQDIGLWQREMLVLTYLDFLNWLKSATNCFLLLNIKDLDKERSCKKVLEYDDFIKLIDKLDDKFRVVAKLLYLGGQRTLEEILSLDVTNVVFDKLYIIFDKDHVSYSLHVFEDLKSLIGEKKMGPVFLGRQGSPLNPATVFRNIREASIRAGLHPSFSPKSLLQSVKVE